MKRIQLEDQSKSVVEIDEATMVLIREGLDAIDRGEVMTFEEAEAEIDREYEQWLESQEKLAA